MNNKFYDYSKVDFSKINYIQFVEKDNDNVNHQRAKYKDKIFKKDFVSCELHKSPKNNFLLSHMNLFYNGNNKINITTPIMQNVFGINKKYNSFNMCISFADIENNPNIKGFYDIIKAFEFSQMAYIGLTEKTQNEYISQIKYPEDDKYDPFITIKLPFRYNKFDVDIYNKEYSGMGIMDIRHGNKLRCNIYIDTIQKYNGKYMCKWKCSYIEMIS